MWPFKTNHNPSPAEEDLPAGLVEQARQNPGGYVYTIDKSIIDPSGEVPFFAIVGWHKVNDAGRIDTPFEKNPKYDPEETRLWVASKP